MANHYSAPQKRNPYSTGTADLFDSLTTGAADPASTPMPVMNVLAPHAVGTTAAQHHTSMHTYAPSSSFLSSSAVPMQALSNNSHGDSGFYPPFSQQQARLSPFSNASMNVDQYNMYGSNSSTTDQTSQAQAQTSATASGFPNHFSTLATAASHRQHQPQQQNWPSPFTTTPTPAPSASTHSHHHIAKHAPPHKVHPHPHPKVHKPSVKHLTCYFWSEFGHCQWSDDNCLYAHWYTGKVASAPVQVEVGKPAVAGRNAESVKPRYEDWRTSSTDNVSMDAALAVPMQPPPPPPPPPPSSLPTGYAAPHATSPIPPTTGTTTTTNTTPDPHANITPLLLTTITTLSQALHHQQERVLGVKDALINHCTSMLELAHAMTGKDEGKGTEKGKEVKIDEFLEASTGLIDAVAEHGRVAEEIAGVLAEVEGRLEEVGVRGVVIRRG